MQETNGIRWDFNTTKVKEVKMTDAPERIWVQIDYDGTWDGRWVRDALDAYRPSGVYYRFVCADMYDAVRQESAALRELLAVYQQAVNKIDDYFEYRHDSERDASWVRDQLDDLGQSLRALCVNHGE